MQSQFTEKEILHDALTSQKNITGLFNASSNECACKELQKTMLDILNDEHAIQFDVFSDMHSRGYYPTTAAQQDKIQQARSTHAQQASNAPTNTGAWHTGAEEKKEPRI